MSTIKSEFKNSPAFREIRASYDNEGIIVYQAFNAEIATAAVREQKLNASTSYRIRMTWIKPSWCWMLYRSGYSYKDDNQSNILAIKVSHEGFKHLLASSTQDLGRANLKGLVRVQWDPERSPRIGKLDYRSIQMGIPNALIKPWIDNWIIGIEDVTEKARELRKVLNEDPKIDREELEKRGLVPVERVYEVSEELKELLLMDKNED